MEYFDKKLTKTSEFWDNCEHIKKFDVSMVLVEEVWLICLDLLKQCRSHFNLLGMNCVLRRKYSKFSNEKIPSEMEIALRYKLLKLLFILFKLLYTDEVMKQ